MASPPPPPPPPSLSTIHGGGGCGCFMPGRETLARDHNVCAPPPHSQSKHNFPTWLYVFSRWLRFWLKNKVLTGGAIRLVAMGTGTDEDVSRFSGCLVSARARVRAGTRSLWVNVYGERVRPRLCKGLRLMSAWHVRAGSCFRGLFSSPEGYCALRWKVRAAPRTDRSRRGFYNRAASSVIYLALWRRGSAHFTAY